MKWIRVTMSHDMQNVNALCRHNPKSRLCPHTGVPGEGAMALGKGNHRFAYHVFGSHFLELFKLCSWATLIRHKHFQALPKQLACLEWKNEAAFPEIQNKRTRGFVFFQAWFRHIRSNSGMCSGFADCLAKKWLAWLQICKVPFANHGHRSSLV